MPKLLNIFSGLIALGLIGFGIFAIADTNKVTAIVSLEPKGVAGLSEARTIYGGLFLAIGGLILYALASARAKAPLLFATSVLFGGFVFGRIVSIMMNGYDSTLTGPIISEIVASVVLFATGKASDAAGK